MASKQKVSRHEKKMPNVVKAKKNPSAIISVLCPDIEKAKKETKPTTGEAKECPRTQGYKPPADKRTYLEQAVVPILMEGMLGLAREMPRDPLGYLEKFWLQDKHKCDIELPQNLL
ncbi:protein dpy-30 homolog [Drosophila eugracilis]|uniref:protein dpy-30 homolog n=1 Tax=Drosophila eugracilis TaxID=29029 RepID=UPI0007E73267|nr:protein dpy-30 homolog [Drosophila eugracilis]